VSPALVVDASVALKWVLDEDDSSLARALAARELAAPDLLWSECANGLWRWVRQGALRQEVAQDRFETLRRAPVLLTPAATLLEQGLALALALDRPVYDCVYLALGLTRGAQLVSADRRFVNRVRRRADLSNSIMLLSELAH